MKRFLIPALFGLGFCKKGRTMVFPEVPQVQLFVDGNAIETPAFPVRASDYNGITGYDLYETAVNMPVGTVTADAPGVDIEITQATPESVEAVVKCTWKGVSKTYKIRFI